MYVIRIFHMLLEYKNINIAIFIITFLSAMIDVLIVIFCHITVFDEIININILKNYR